MHVISTFVGLCVMIPFFDVFGGAAAVGCPGQDVKRPRVVRIPDGD